MSELNPVQQRAARRIEAIRQASARIQAKIDAGHPRSKDLQARLAEYARSLEHLEVEMKFGRPFRLKGEATAGGVVVTPDAGGLTAKGA